MWCGRAGAYEQPAVVRRHRHGHRHAVGREVAQDEVLVRSNAADALAAAVLVMGEGAEQTPLAVLTGVPGIRFTPRAPAAGGRRLARLEVPLEEDLYWPLLRGAPWKRGRRGPAPADD